MGGHSSRWEGGWTDCIFSSGRPTGFGLGTNVRVFIFYPKNHHVFFSIFLANRKIFLGINIDSPTQH